MPQKEQKIAAAVYLYQVDNDGEWGEIRFDFATGTAEIVWGRGGYGKVQCLCKDGDSVHLWLAGGAAAERGCCDV